MRAFWITAGLWFLLDQATKLGIVFGLDLINRQVIEVIPGILRFRMGWNYGVNFGLGAGFDLRWVLVALALVISVWMVFWARRGLQRPLARIAAGAIVGGAIGNALDRVVYGAVADFLNVTCCGIANPYAFNFADIGIFMGAAGLLLFADSPPKTP